MVEVAGFDEVAYLAARLCDRPLPGVCRFGLRRHLWLHRQPPRGPVKASVLSAYPQRHMVRHHAVGLGLTTPSRGVARYRKSVVSGTSVPVRLAIGGRHFINK